MLTTIDKSPKAKTYTVTSRAPLIEQVERILVTPSIAQAWLDKNAKNRKMSSTHVGKLARDMTKGRWEFSGEAIKFDVAGNLVDGQHRLAACVKADVPFETLVVYNLPTEAQAVLDTGKVRSAADVLSLDGMHYANHLAAACRLIASERDGTNVLEGSRYSTPELIDTLQYHKELPSVVNAVAGVRYPKGVSVAHVAALVYVGKHLLNVPLIADKFAEVMANGVPIYDGDAAHALRERIIKASVGPMTFRKSDKWKLMKHAWNLFSAQQPVRLFRVPTEVRILDLNYDLL
jgi:hypothetical protein